MNRLDRFVIGLLFVVLAFYLFERRAPIGDDPITGRRPVPPPAEISPEAPSPVPPRARRPLPIAPSPADPPFVVELYDMPKASSGTAFPVDDRGAWMTARHVVLDCTDIGLLRWGERTVSRATLAYAHPSADLAVIAARRTASPVAFSETPLEVGLPGFSLGFPQGQIGAAYLQLIGRSRMHAKGRMTGASPTLAWAEVRRFPGHLETLGGMSGGPVVDQDGNLIGVLVAGSERRGRIHSLAPEVLREVRLERLPPAGAQARPLGEVRQGPGKLPQIAETVAREFRVAKVYCRRS
jgi:S1-C subfamily serine protease